MNRNSKVLIPVALLLVVVGAWGFHRFQLRQESETAVVDLCAEVDRELGKDRPDRSELSSLMGRILKLPQHGDDPRLRRARARIEQARGNPKSAWQLIESLAGALDSPSPADQILGVRLLVELHRASGVRQQALQAMEIAERHHRATDEPESLLIAWQCAQRIGDEERRKRLADELIRDHPAAVETRLVQTLIDLGETDLATLERLEGEFTAAPVELRLAIVIRLLEAGRQADGLRVLDQLVSEAPALIDVRHCAAFAYSMMAADAPARGLSEAQQKRLRTQRDSHLGWLLDNAPPDDARRELWQSWSGDR